MTCPQCKQPVEGAIRPGEAPHYAVGWCRLDIHVRCLALHIRACRPCRTHNEDWLARQEVHT
jgi:hypothetical protein